MSMISKQPGNTSASAALVFINSGLAGEDVPVTGDKNMEKVTEDLSAGEHISKRIKQKDAVLSTGQSAYFPLPVPALIISKTM